MADNTRGGSQDAGDPLIATDEVTYSGDTADVQLVRVVGVTGAEGAKTVVEPTLPVSGDVAHDDADSGNPVKIGGKASTSPPAEVADADRVDAYFDARGSQFVRVTDSSGVGATILAGAPSDATDASTGSYLEVNSFPMVFNGTTWDRLRGDWSGIYVSRTFGDQGGEFSQLGNGGPSNDGLITSARGYAAITDSTVLVFNGTTWDRLRGDTLGLHISRQATAATATLSNVASSASSVTLLALNTARKGASIHNDSTQILYVKFGTTASATSYTVKMAADAHYEVPFGYTGRIDGIWASANGNARVTEMT